MENIGIDKVYDNEYFRINKILNLSTGLWPYNVGTPRIIVRLMVACTLGIATIPHVSITCFDYI